MPRSTCVSSVSQGAAVGLGFIQERRFGRCFCCFQSRLLEVPERAVTVQICASERRNVSPDVCVSNLALTSILTFKKKKF